MTRSTRVSRAFLILMAAVVGMGGCVYLYSRDRTTIVKGDLPDDSVLAAVVEGATSDDWVISTLGEPTFTKELEGGGALLIYQYETEDTTTTRVLIVMYERSQVTRVVRLNFEIRDGVVVRFWRDPDS